MTCSFPAGESGPPTTGTASCRHGSTCSGRPRGYEDAHISAVRPLPPGTYRLTARVFAGLFTDYDLHNVTSGYIALPKGTPMFTGASLGEVARRISKASGYEHPDPADS